MTAETDLNFPFPKKSIYNDCNIFMVSWWGTDSYFNNKLIQICDIEMMTSEYGSSGSFESIVRSKSIGHTHIQAEEVISVQNQHQLMDQFTNHILMIHTQEVTLVGYHNQLPK